MGGGGQEVDEPNGRRLLPSDVLHHRAGVVFR